MPSHLDYRDQGFRGTYWNQPQLPETSLHSPSKAETLRKQKLTRQDNADQYRTDKASSKPDQPMYSSLDRFPEPHLGVKLHESSGSVRSLPTQLCDKPVTVNVNHLRATSQEAIWKGYITGNRTYNPKANLGNWVEERFDLSYLHGNSSQMFKRAYESTASASAKEATGAYQQKMVQANMTAKQPDPTKEHRSINRHRPNYINYAGADPTPSTKKQGSYWVGTAASDTYETTNKAAYGERKKQEYQYRCPSSDPKSRMLCGMKPNHQPEPDALDKYRSQWTIHEGVKRSEKTWKSETHDKLKDWVDIAPELDTRRAVKEEVKSNVTDFGQSGAGAFL